MKKIVSLLLAACITISLLAGCGGTVPETTAPATIPTSPSVPETTAPETTSAQTEALGIDTDENLFTVDITLPASLFEGEDMSEFDTDAYAEENGFIKAVVNEDGSLTVTMTKARHTELLEEMAQSLDESFAAFVEAADTPYIKEITHNDDFSSIEIKVVRADYENTWDMTSFSVGISAMLYQAFLDVEYHVEVSVIDVDTGDVISAAIYPDVFG